MTVHVDRTDPWDPPLNATTSRTPHDAGIDLIFLKHRAIVLPRSAFVVADLKGARPGRAGLRRCVSFDRTG
jgi:hypothetical protein